MYAQRMAQRTYGQYCGLARALDLVGERWTLLVLRELLTGPKRFSDLLDGLPGVGTALLTARLRSLEQLEVVRRRRLAPPAGSTVYELTDAGRELEPMLLGLARWGAARLGAPTEDLVFRPRWAMVAMASAHDAEAARGVREIYEFEVGEEVFHADVDDGRVELHDGPGHRPAVRVRADPASFARIAHDPRAVGDAGVQVDGQPDAVRRCGAIFAPAGPGVRGGVGRRPGR